MRVGRFGAGGQRRSLGAVVPVVVDVDSSCDATDDEGDPSGNQIEPGEERGLGVRETANQGNWNQVLRNLDSGSLSHLLSPLNSVRMFCLGCKAPTGQAQ